MAADEAMDLAAVERAALGVSLKLPRVPHRGRLGDVRSASVGSSLELHDFRSYHPGDDLRHVDWNAVARTGELIVRVRQDEVSPRVEVLLDASASMAVSGAKAARAKEIALWVVELARRGGFEPVLFIAGREVQQATGPSARAAMVKAVLDGRLPFDAALTHLPPLRACGLRVVVSDFLVEAAPGPLVERLARQAAGCVLVQVLDPEDLEPTGGEGARLTDSESGEVLERLLSEAVVDTYRARLTAHLSAWRGAAQRVRATWVQVSAADPLDVLVRRSLSPLVDAS